MDLQSLAALSDSELLARVKRLAQAECRATAALIAHLIEVENRKLYLGEACSSLFAYCVRVLHFSEPAAYNRIFAARAAKEFPAVLSHLERGDVHLAAVRLLAPVLTPENHRALLAAAVHKSKREVEELVVRIRPQADVRGSVRKLPAAARPLAVTPPAMAVGAAAAGLRPAEVPQPCRPQQPAPALLSPPEGGADDAARSLFESAREGLPAPQRAVVVPLAPERYKIQFTAGAATRDKLRRAQELLCHRIPGGDVSEVIDLALDLLVRDLEKRKFAALAPRRGTETAAAAPAPAEASIPPAAATAPAVRAATASNSRHIPAEVRRAVWQRDQGSCAFTAVNGERCGERSGLEFDHIRPHADGGGAEVNNIRLLCRQHNQYEAQQFFGTWQTSNETAPRCG